MKPKTWFISDTHFMHQNVALLRGYWWDAWKRPVQLGEVKQLWNNIKSS